MSDFVRYMLLFYGKTPRNLSKKTPLSPLNKHFYAPFFKSNNPDLSVPQYNYLYLACCAASTFFPSDLTDKIHRTQMMTNIPNRYGTISK